MVNADPDSEDNGFNNGIFYMVFRLQIINRKNRKKFNGFFQIMISNNSVV